MLPMSSGRSHLWTSAVCGQGAGSMTSSSFSLSFVRLKNPIHHLLLMKRIRFFYVNVGHIAVGCLQRETCNKGITKIGDGLTPGDHSGIGGLAAGDGCRAGE